MKKKIGIIALVSVLALGMASTVTAQELTEDVYSESSINGQTSSGDYIYMSTYDGTDSNFVKYDKETDTVVFEEAETDIAGLEEGVSFNGLVGIGDGHVFLVLDDDSTVVFYENETVESLPHVATSVAGVNQETEEIVLRNFETEPTTYTIVDMNEPETVIREIQESEIDEQFMDIDENYIVGKENAFEGMLTVYDRETLEEINSIETTGSYTTTSIYPGRDVLMLYNNNNEEIEFRDIETLDELNSSTIDSSNDLQDTIGFGYGYYVDHNTQSVKAYESNAVIDFEVDISNVYTGVTDADMLNSGKNTLLYVNSDEQDTLSYIDGFNHHEQVVETVEEDDEDADPMNLIPYIIVFAVILGALGMT